MTLIRLGLLVFVLMVVKPVHAEFSHYITREGSVLLENGKPFRFFGIHAPELHRIEDDAKGHCAVDKRNWAKHFKWPTLDEQENWIQALTRSGHKAMRIYVLSVENVNDLACQRETHILAPLTPLEMPRLNENAMMVYDRMVALADKHGLRLILPFIDHWHWWGGRAELAAFYGEEARDFYDTTSKTYQAYQAIIRQVITRKNTITGRFYYEEKAIMAWETGNELVDSTPQFVAETSAWIKQFAPNQLVVDGTYLRVLQSSLSDPNVDIISNHFYSVNNNNQPQTVIEDLTAIAGQKAYIVGEFGLLPVKEMSAIADAIATTSVNGHTASGGFIWGFRGHRHNGGFYWHSEGDSGYMSYRLPGFDEGQSNSEKDVIKIARNTQAKMAGLSAPPALPIPLPPILRKVSDSGVLSFMGSPLGELYRIERRVKGEKKWTVIADGISDGKLKFDPEKDELFQDCSAKPSSVEIDYRVIATNASGESVPSNIVTKQY